MAMGSGISSSVSRQAKPNIMPWSPAPSWSRSSRRVVLAMLERVVDAHGDVGRLLLDRRDHAAGLAVEPELRVRVADLDDRVAHDRGDVDIALFQRDLAGHEHEARRDERLARDPAVGVLGEQRVQDRVGDLVGELVGMPLGDGFGREEVALAHDRRSLPAVADTVRTVRGPPWARAARRSGPRWRRRARASSSRARRPRRRAPRGSRRRSCPRRSPVPARPTSLATSRSRSLRASFSRPAASTS